MHILIILKRNNPKSAHKTLRSTQLQKSLIVSAILEIERGSLPTCYIDHVVVLIQKHPVVRKETNVNITSQKGTQNFLLFLN